MALSSVIVGLLLGIAFSKHASHRTCFIAAMLKEVNVPGGSNGFLYTVLQHAANEARQRGLLINPNPFTRETYSTAVGNTDRMLPSEYGWEQTKGILMRHIILAKTLLSTPRRLGPQHH